MVNGCNRLPFVLVGQLSGEGIEVPVLCFILLFLDFGVFCPMYCLSGEKNNKLAKRKRAQCWIWPFKRRLYQTRLYHTVFCVLCQYIYFMKQEFYASIFEIRFCRNIQGKLYCVVWNLDKEWIILWSIK